MGDFGRSRSTSGSAVVLAGFLALGLSSAVVAQRVDGRVQLADRTPVVDVSVLMVDSAGKTLAHGTTNASGRYLIDWLPRATRMTISRIGTRPAVVILPPGEPRDTSIDVTMEAAVVATLDTVHAESDKVHYFSPTLQDFETRRASGSSSGHFVSDFQLRKFDNSSMATVIPSKVPGIRLIWYRSQIFMASSRGSEKRRAEPNDPRSPVGCWVSVVVDGMVLYKGPPFPPPDVSHMPVADFAGVEFYEGSSTVPPKFAGINAPCGLLLLWTREK
jgi:hypothetical protein